MTSFNAQQIAIVQTVFEQSNSGKIHFGEVIQQLIHANIESYVVDYRRGESTYYLSNGESIRHTFYTDISSIAIHFDALAIKQAILGAQSGQVMYPEFKNLTYHAGCVGYVVWITGKNVQYFGRLGEIHLEKFPE